MIQTKLQIERKEKNMSYEDVAKAVGISTSGYWQIENGKRNASYSTMVKISRIFDRTPDDIFLDNELTKS